MAFSVKDWKNSPDTSTPLSAENLEDMEERLSDYTDQEISQHNIDTTNVHGISDTSVLATESYADAAQSAAEATAAAELATHAADTTSVHGLSDTAAIKGFINHGATASTARPSGFTSVEWLGSVEPSNATNDDTWVDTS